jgi:hypothetical protein
MNHPRCLESRKMTLSFSCKCRLQFPGWKQGKLNAFLWFAKNEGSFQVFSDGPSQDKMVPWPHRTVTQRTQKFCLPQVFLADHIPGPHISNQIEITFTEPSTWQNIPRITAFELLNNSMNYEANPHFTDEETETQHGSGSAWSCTAGWPAWLDSEASPTPVLSLLLPKWSRGIVWSATWQRKEQWAHLWTVFMCIFEKKRTVPLIQDSSAMWGKFS